MLVKYFQLLESNLVRSVKFTAIKEYLICKSLFALTEMAA